MIWQWLLVPLAYAMGSLSSAVIVSQLFGLPDPREQGSKNPGATNVLRLGGTKAAVMTLIGDVLKGLIPVLIAKILGAGLIVLGLVGLAAFFGHLYPVFFEFKGGKGVATALGVLTGFAWPIGVTCVAIWFCVALTFRISSLSAIVAALLAPALVWLFLGKPGLVVVTGLMSGLLIWRHKDNIQRIIAGQESRIGG